MKEAIAYILIVVGTYKNNSMTGFSHVFKSMDSCITAANVINERARGYAFCVQDPMLKESEK